jgi:hypothetical protein
MARPSVARAVRDYIDTRPVVRDALAMGIINLSALTRRIQQETGIAQEEAVLVACRRYRPKQRSRGYEDAIRRVLDQCKLEVRTRVAVLTFRASWRLLGRLDKAIAAATSGDPVHVLHGSESVTVILDEATAPEIEEALGKEEILKKTSGLVEVNLRSPSRIEDVPGILAFLVSSLSDRGINLLQVISCHKDNMFILETEDLFPAMQVLNGLIQG